MPISMFNLIQFDSHKIDTWQAWVRDCRRLVLVSGRNFLFANFNPKSPHLPRSQGHRQFDSNMTVGKAWQLKQISVYGFQDSGARGIICYPHSTFSIFDHSPSLAQGTIVIADSRYLISTCWCRVEQPLPFFTSSFPVQSLATTLTNCQWIGGMLTADRNTTKQKLKGINGIQRILREDIPMGSVPWKVPRTLA